MRNPSFEYVCMAHPLALGSSPRYAKASIPKLAQVRVRWGNQIARIPMSGCVALLDVNTLLKSPEGIVAIVAEMVLDAIPAIAQPCCRGNRIVRILMGGGVVLLDVNTWLKSLGNIVAIVANMVLDTIPKTAQLCRRRQCLKRVRKGISQRQRRQCLKRGRKGISQRQRTRLQVQTPMLQSQHMFAHSAQMPDTDALSNAGTGRLRLPLGCRCR
jgi:hypothetical protein